MYLHGYINLRYPETEIPPQGTQLRQIFFKWDFEAFYSIKRHEHLNSLDKSITLKMLKFNKTHKRKTSTKLLIDKAIFHCNLVGYWKRGGKILLSLNFIVNTARLHSATHCGPVRWVHIDRAPLIRLLLSATYFSFWWNIPNGLN